MWQAVLGTFPERGLDSAPLVKLKLLKCSGSSEALGRSALVGGMNIREAVQKKGLEGRGKLRGGGKEGREA